MLATFRRRGSDHSLTSSSQYPFPYAVEECTIEHPSAVISAVFSPNGAYIATGSDDSIVRLWSTTTRKMYLNPMRGHLRAVTTLAYSPDGDLIASGSLDRTIRIWNSTTGTLSGGPYNCYTVVKSVAFSSRGLQIACGCEDGLVQIWDLQTGRMMSAPLVGHGFFVNSVVYSPIHSELLAASSDGTIRFWDTATRQMVRKPLRLSERGVGVSTVSVSADETRIAAGTSNGRVYLCKDGSVQRLRGHQAEVTSTIFPGNQRHLLSSSRDGSMYVFNLDNLDIQAERLKGNEERGPILGLACSASGKQIASFFQSGAVILWRVLPPPPSATPENAPLLPRPNRSYSNMSSLDEFLGEMYDFASGLDSDGGEDLEMNGLWSGLPHGRSTGKVNQVSQSHVKRCRTLRDWTGYLKKGQHIGGGGFGDVVKGEWVNLPSTKSQPPTAVAVKIIHTRVFQGVDPERALQHLMREVDVWLSLRHKNITPFVGITYDFGDDPNIPSLISAWMPNEHDPSIIHGDIKADNVLVDSHGNVRLGDFGLSRMLCNETLWLTAATSAPGSVRWMAPELLEGNQPTVTKESDVWAWGMTALEVMTNKAPFVEKYNFDGAVTIAVVVRNERPRRPSSEREGEISVEDWFWRLLGQCWERNPDDRLRINQLVQQLEIMLD